MNITLIKLNDNHVGVLVKVYNKEKVITCDMVICDMDISCSSCIFSKALYEGVKKEYLICKEVDF